MNEKQKQTFLLVMVFGAIAIVGSLYAHFFFNRDTINSTLKKIGTQQKKNAELEADFKELQRWANNESEMEARKAEIQRFTRRLPSSVDAPGFLSALLGVLRSTGIIQERVKSESPIGRSQYTEIPYGVKAYGRFHELGQFLTLIEQNPDRFMRVKSMEIRNNLARPSVHPIDMQIKTFTFAASASAPSAEGSGQ